MRASIEVADIFRSAGPAYRANHVGHLSLHQLKIMSAIEHCRTAALGGHVEACTDCGHWRVAYKPENSEFSICAQPDREAVRNVRRL